MPTRVMEITTIPAGSGACVLGAGVAVVVAAKAGGGVRLATIPFAFSANKVMLALSEYLFGYTMKY